MHYSFLIIDESGSMSNVKDETIQSVNKVIEQLFLTYPSGSHFICTFKSKNKISKLKCADSSWTYRPNGGTALYDALFDCITFFKIAATEKQDSVYIGVFTDGDDNRSRHTKQEIEDEINSIYDFAEQTTLFYGGTNIEDWRELAQKVPITTQKVDTSADIASCAQTMVTTIHGSAMRKCSKCDEQFNAQAKNSGLLTIGKTILRFCPNCAKIQRTNPNFVIRN